MTTPHSQNEPRQQIEKSAAPIPEGTLPPASPELRRSEIATLLRENGNEALAEILALASAGTEANAAILEAYPHIAILGDAASYGGDGNEIKRTLKSMLNLSRFVENDTASLGGSNAPAIAEGLGILRELTLQGLLRLGRDRDADGQGAALAAGYERLMGILSIHDLAKSEKIAHIAEEKLGCTDHDIALTHLVRDDFRALDGVLTDEQVASLRQAISDPIVREFFEKPRAIVGFNAGRHLQGEGPKNLFTASVKDVDAACLAEFIADWSGVNGHQDPTGPVLLANVPPAVNGTAKALQKLLEAKAASSDMAEVYEEFSYPAETLAKLGLERQSETGKAIARVAFIGREHQQKDSEVGRTHAEALKKAFDGLPASLRKQLVSELNADDLDLGFTPHTMAEIRSKQAQGGAETAQVTEQSYKIFLLALHRVIEEVRAHRLTQPVITANLNVKVSGAKLSDALDVTADAAGAISQVEVSATRDKQNVFAVDFKRCAPAQSLDALPAAKLDQLPGKRVLVGGYGGGGDVYQAGSVAISLEAHGKIVPAVFSVRRGDLSKVEKQLENFEIVDREHNLIRILPDTSGTIGTTSRLPERGAARADLSRPVYLILDNDEGRTLDKKIERLARHIQASTGNAVETIAGVDTGGDSLEPKRTAGADSALSTPDQDHASLAALSRIQGYHTYSFVVAPGIDSPAEFPAILAKANASVHVAGDQERAGVHSYLTRTGLGGDDSVMSKTSLVCKTLANPEGAELGYRYIDGIPERYRLNRANPWKAWVKLQPSMKALCIMTSADHLKAIEQA